MSHIHTFDAYIGWHIEQKVFALDAWKRSPRRAFWQVRIVRASRDLSSLRILRNHLRQGGDIRLLKPFEQLWYEALAKNWQVEQQFDFDWFDEAARAERREIWAVFDEKAGRLIAIYGDAA